MKEKFTQGEWVIHPHPDSNSIIGICLGKHQDSFAASSVTLYSQENDANANLITAAPNGFELGLLVMELCGQPSGVSEQQSDLLYETALSFVKKARGEDVN